MTKIKKIIILFMSMFMFFAIVNKVNAASSKMLITLANMQNKNNHYYCLDHRGHQSKWNNNQYYVEVGTLYITTGTKDDATVFYADWNGRRP